MASLPCYATWAASTSVNTATTTTPSTSQATGMAWLTTPLACNI